MSNTLSKSLLNSISEAIKTLENGNEDEALSLLVKTEKSMENIIEMIKVEDQLALLDAAPIDM